MNLDLGDVETRALLNLLVEAIENDRYPLSPRIRVLRGILAKLGELAPPPPARLRGPNTQHYRIVSAAVEILANTTVPLPPREIRRRLDAAGINPFDWGDQHYREATLTTVLNLEVKLPNARLARAGGGRYRLSPAELERRLIK